MTCPNCTAPMDAHVLAGHHGTEVTLDVCLSCQLFWFDAKESLQLTPASTLQLFRLIGEHTSGERQAVTSTSSCPRCGLRLKPVHDIQRNTKFSYRRCPREHGRLVTFFDFLREKNFIKPMSPAQIDELRRHVGAVNCSNCGASINLVKDSACTHCGSALSMLDADRAGTLVAELRAADRSSQPVDPTLPLRLEQARREAARAFESPDDAWYAAVADSGTVSAGLQALVRWMRRNA